MGRPRVVTAETVARARQLARDGLTRKEAAAALGLPEATLGYWIAKTGERFTDGRTPPAVRRLNPTERADYDRLVYRHAYRSADAFRAIGRPDLVGWAP